MHTWTGPHGQPESESGNSAPLILGHVGVVIVSVVSSVRDLQLAPMNVVVSTRPTVFRQLAHSAAFAGSEGHATLPCGYASVVEDAQARIGRAS